MAVGGLWNLWMGATRGFLCCCWRMSAVKIEPVLLPVHRPTLHQSFYTFGVGNAESEERQQRGANADVQRRSFTDVPTARTPRDRSPDVPLGPSPLTHGVQIVSQPDECLEGHALMPSGTEVLDHFWEPDSLRIGGGHV